MSRVSLETEVLLKFGYKNATPQDLRDSDKKLLLAYWERNNGLVLTDQQKVIFMNNCDIAESITRARRELKKDYPPSPKVDEGRYQKFKDYTDNYSSKAVHVSFKD